jgi:hypothetical protein
MSIASLPDWMERSVTADDESPVRQIDGHAVIFRRGEGWRCDCDTWKARRDCEHALKAAALVTLERGMRSQGKSIRRH